MINSVKYVQICSGHGIDLWKWHTANYGDPYLEFVLYI